MKTWQVVKMIEGCRSLDELCDLMNRCDAGVYSTGIKREKLLYEKGYEMPKFAGKEPVYDVDESAECVVYSYDKHRLLVFDPREELGYMWSIVPASTIVGHQRGDEHVW